MRAALFAAALVSAALVATSSDARAEDGLGDPFATKPAYAVMATAFAGDGLRFDNPYRLATVLGSNAQSLSRTAVYGDLGAAIVLGQPYDVRHGIALRWSFAVEGIAQSAITPSYEIWKRWSAWAAYGRVGPSIVVGPDATWGMEAAIGGVWFVRGGIGIGGEIVGDVFYGAGTTDVAVAAYPILSAQFGVTIDLEVLP